LEPSGITTPAESPVSAATPPAPWSPATRLGFRIAFLYFFCFIFFDSNGTLFQAFPVVGGWIQDKLNWPFNHLSEFIGRHLFHLTGIAAHWHPSDSGDTTMNWIQNGLLFTFALAGGILWTVIAHLRNNRRTEYRTLHAWLRFFLRLTCGMFMLIYGLVKVFPLQMPPPSIAILNEPAGNMAPMTFLWNLIGLNPVYEIICGSAEFLGGILLFYRRTALAGALFSTFVVANVVLYNFCYDVPSSSSPSTCSSAASSSPCPTPSPSAASSGATNQPRPPPFGFPPPAAAPGASPSSSPRLSSPPPSSSSGPSS
jgi:hypothetical protein